MPDALWILVAWAALTLPHLSTRSLIWEEGTGAELARNILAGGNPLHLAIYGVHWVEKPPLLSTLIAATARITSRLDEWSIRLPAMLAVLATVFLVQREARRYGGRSASLFAAGCFLFCPLLLRKLTISEPDTLVTALSFAAFLLWWRGIESGHVSPWRWAACSLVLVVLVMAKGPQPVAYFGLGAGAFLFLQRRLRALPALILCLSLPALAIVAWALAVHRQGDTAVWITQMHMAEGLDAAAYFKERPRFLAGLMLDLLPATLLLPMILELWRREHRGRGQSVIVALVTYAGLATLALAAWPGARTRYAMVAVPAVAVLAGIAVSRLGHLYPRLTRLSVVVLVILMSYQAIVVHVAMPLFPDRFDATRSVGQTLGRTVETGTPAIATGAFTNELFYARIPIRVLRPDEAFRLPSPATLFTTPTDLARIVAARPDLSFTVLVKTAAGPGLLAARIQSAGNNPR